MRLVATALALLLVALTGTATAQYFGPNKVRYQTFDFRVLKTDHFDVYYYPDEKRAAEEAARMAERWYTRLSRLLDHRLSSRQPLILYASHPHFEQTNAVSGFIGESVGGVTEALQRRIVLPFGATAADTDHVLGHELVHAFQFDLASRLRQQAQNLPLWFVEGMAEYLSVGPIDPHTATWLRDAVIHERLPRIRDLDNPRYFPYRFGQAFWAYLAGRLGDSVVGLIYRAALTADPVNVIEAATRLDADALSNEWHAAIRASYAPVLEARGPADERARPLFDKRNPEELNVSPALSPDGTRVVVLSSRDRLSIDLYLVDADSGRVIRRLSRSATDPHLDSLQFVNAAGSWERDGRIFAYPSVRRGRPVVTLYDTTRGQVDRQIELPDVAEVVHPALAPDASALVFSGIQGGVSDLYLYDLRTNRLERLTNDLTADLQPAWSPDGQRIAFVTERFSSRLDVLNFGPPRLAVLDRRRGTLQAIELPRAFDAGKQISPQWSADGESLYFLGDPYGVTDVYRVELASGEVSALTRLATGAMGITDTSPALSVAARSERIAFSTLHRGGHQIYMLDRAEPIAEPSHSRALAVTLPPVQREENVVAELLATPTRGLPPPQDFPQMPYRPSLELQYAGQPYIAAGVDAFGPAFGGGVAFLFSDVLGDHNVGVAAMLQGDLRDFSGQASYLNRKSRWGWGGVVEQLTYRTGTLSQRLGVVDGSTVLIEEVTRFRQIQRQVTALAEYPFSRAQRVELSGSARSIVFDIDVFSQRFDSSTGELLADSEQKLPSPPALTFGEVSAAFVHDTGVLGPTSPLAGQRYRLEVGQTAGDVRFTNLLADYRHYAMPVRPVTFAGRALVVGRFGRDASDPRLTPLFLGYSTLVRGYEFDSFEFDDCNPTLQSDCPEFDRLIGERIVVLNGEVRFPLIGVFKGELDYGSIPVEGLLFADAGLAWSENRQSRAAHDIARSVGAGVRVNTLGFAVIEMVAVRPLDRRRGWFFSFGLRPGF